MKLGRDIREVTVFGGSGFVGRHVVQALAARGLRLRIACRDPLSAQFLKPLGDVGQIVPVQANLRHAGSVAAAIAGADAVINLVGVLYQSGAQKFHALHAEGATNMAAAAQQAGVQRFIHISAIGADGESASKYARSKAKGEAGVLANFANATILRPSVIFGPNDSFLNRFALLAQFLPVLPLIGGGLTKMQPIYAGDVAEALVAALIDDSAQSRIYELGGPQVYTLAEIMAYVCRETGRRRLLVPLPFQIAKLKAFFLQLLPNPLLTVDQVELLKTDNLADAGALGLADLGVTPTSMESIAPNYLARYRKGGRLIPNSIG